MDPVKVEFMFDFGSPNAYLAEKVIPEIERRTGVTFEYVPVLLGGIYKLTNNRSPGESLAGIKNKPDFMEVETQRFIRRHNITTFHKNPFFPVNTLQLMRGAVAAQFEGVFEPYFRAAYHHMWEAPKKMDDPHVAREAFISSNIDFDRLLARSQQPDAGAHPGRRRSRTRRPRQWPPPRRAVDLCRRTFPKPAPLPARTGSDSMFIAVRGGFSSLVTKLNSMQISRTALGLISSIVPRGTSFHR